MKILIIGAGAIGCMLAARLAGVGHEVTLAARPKTARQIIENGLRLIESDGRVQVAKVEVTPGIGEALTGASPYDLAVIAVKAYHTETVGRELKQCWQAGCPVLTVQNGVGNEEILAAHLAGVPILAGILTTPVEVLEPGHVRIARPSFRFAVAPGPDAGGVGINATLFEGAGFKVQRFSDYRALKWTKLLMNILANAQAAILRYTPAQIFSDKKLGNLEITAWRETLAVMQRLGVRPLPLAGYPLPMLAPLIQRLPLDIVRPVLGRFIAGGRGSKMPSLYYDLYPQLSPPSEIEWLNGAVTKAARQLGLAVPVNETFNSVFSDILAGRSQPSDWANQPQRLLDAVAENERA
ncbi:MAG: 2-dehydropantoate 2-reductase [Chloroflexi bacterium]|nr:2-dehydropantoate 2-reductase [Chloroflexota bacterium]